MKTENIFQFTFDAEEKNYPKSVLSKCNIYQAHSKPWLYSYPKHLCVEMNTISLVFLPFWFLLAQSFQLKQVVWMPQGGT